MCILREQYKFVISAHTELYYQYGRFIMRSFLYAILSVTVVIDMSLLGMLIARLEKDPEIWTALLRNLNNFFEFL